MCFGVLRPCLTRVVKYVFQNVFWSVFSARPAVHAASSGGKGSSQENRYFRGYCRLTGNPAQYFAAERGWRDLDIHLGNFDSGLTFVLLGSVLFQFRSNFCFNANPFECHSSFSCNSIQFQYHSETSNNFSLTTGAVNAVIVGAPLRGCQNTEETRAFKIFGNQTVSMTGCRVQRPPPGIGRRTFLSEALVWSFSVTILKWVTAAVELAHVAPGSCEFVSSTSLLRRVSLLSLVRAEAVRGARAFLPMGSHERALQRERIPAWRDAPLWPGPCLDPRP
jgi:hypothetical protein